jgi:hypothetical protein
MVKINLEPVAYYSLSESFLERELALTARLALLDERWFSPTSDPEFRIGLVRNRTLGELHPAVRSCCNVLAGPKTSSLVTNFVGSPASPVESFKFFRMRRYDYIATHDDVVDHVNRIAVVLDLTLGWRRCFGGNTVVGVASRTEGNKRTEMCYSPRWVFDSHRSVLLPKFNSLLILPVRRGFAHRITPICSDHPRLMIQLFYKYV